MTAGYWRETRKDRRTHLGNSFTDEYLSYFDDFVLWQQLGVWGQGDAVARHAVLTAEVTPAAPQSIINLADQVTPPPTPPSLPLGDRNSQVVVLAAVSVCQKVREGKEGRSVVLPRSLQSTSHMESSAKDGEQYQPPPTLTQSSHFFCLLIFISGVFWCFGVFS